MTTTEQEFFDERANFHSEEFKKMIDNDSDSDEGS
jgi:hypothetical protein